MTEVARLYHRGAANADSGLAAAVRRSMYRYTANDIELVECVDGNPYSRWWVPMESRETSGVNGLGEQKQSFMALDTYTPTHMI